IHGHWRLAKALPSELHRVEILCEGRVLSPPELGALRWRFEFRLQRCQGEHGWQQMGQRLRLGWYRPSDHLSPPRGGEQWRLALKLKLPRGQLNPDGFDYETWLFQRGFQGTGYVSDAQASYRMSAAPWWSLAHWRTELRDRLHNKLPDTSAAGVIPALVLADRSGIEPALWNRFREAGTGHLLAISGLHVGLVAAFGALCGALFWRLVGARFGSRAIWVGGCALAVASGYSALAGFALPTVRALVMLMAVAVFSALGRHRRGMDILGFAFVALLVFDPLSILSAGFWLSFCSVAGIVFGLSTKHHWKPWQQLLWVNAAMGLVLAPLSHLLFGQLAWWCSPANLVVVPVFSFVVVPLSLLGASLAVLDLSGAQSLLSWAAIGITWCDAWQSWLLKLPKPQLPMVGWAPVGLLLLSVGLLLPKLWRGSATLLVAAVVLLISPRQSELPTEGFELTTFDVGHGLAVMVETKEHLLIYDTGPRYGYGRSSGDAVIAPAIRGGGWLAPDIIMVSHEDGDHAGGLPSLERAFGGAEIIRGQSASCAPGRHWSWDGVHFEILHPVATWSGDNDNSCVLRVSSGLGSALLPGDIERRAERRMLERRLEMRSQLLLVPHHGSNSSSSASWLEVVKPELAVISVASDSRWGMPHAPVLQRLQRVGAQVLSTGESGAIVVRFDGSAAAPSVRLIREERRRFWHRP
ncbi:MAG: DNA internalization-related competence protein ComEC/Rec2, partial [Granulosicoccaceae bacterium]